VTASGYRSRLDVEVVVPLRWDTTPATSHCAEVADMSDYLARLGGLVDVTVVDGSRPERFAEHHAAWAPLGPAVVHRPPDERPGLNGKVVGALTGIRTARHELVVLADDDVRHDEQTLKALHDRLADADLVRPQNVSTRWPWHARWDGARSLLNRAVAEDWPGTFGLRRSSVLAAGGWDADVMFENLELVRTLRVAGARLVDAPDVLVPRVPPTTRHFLGQRVRQAYDDFAQPWRLAWALSVLPASVIALRRRPVLLPLAALAAVALAEAGRRRAGAARAVPPDVPLWAPLWVAERGVCSWLAVAQRLRGGVPYRGERLPLAAHSTRTLRRTLPTRSRESTPPAPAAGVEAWRGGLDGGATRPGSRVGRPGVAVAVLPARPGADRFGTPVRGWSLSGPRTCEGPLV
jgi:hypothetical protein